MANFNVVLEDKINAKLEKLKSLERRSKGSIARAAIIEYLQKPEVIARLKGRK